MMTIMNSSQTTDSSSPAVSSRQDPNPKNIMVGVGEDFIRLKGWLVGQPSKAFQVIPIVGMGGIGKTTLARNLYDDPSVISRFDTRAWATISQDYNNRKLQDVLLSLLGCVIGKPKVEMLGMSDDQLALRLHQALIGRRYLIVLDDVWDVKPWDDTRRFFPDDNNGSRIIVTTRESSVAYYTGSHSSYHQMNLLKDDESWNLLHQKVFALEDTCSPELEKIGKKIAKDCRGLPLAIHVIGGILSQAKTSQDFWEHVSDNVSSAIADKGEQCSNILSLSYNRLPNHLKPYFLYMGAFPEDYEIRSSKLIKLLVAEGFVQPILGKSLEEAAEMHLKALVDRNLIFIRQQGTNGNVKSYSIHDLLRDLCARKACEEKFLFIHGCEPDMTQLRHIQFKGPRNYVGYHGKDKNRFFVLDKLQTVSPIGISVLTDRVLETLPNLEKLGIFWDEEVDHLTLRACRILDPNMNEIGKLPNLEILKLRECFFESLKWEAGEGEFCRLQFLLMEKLNLVNWAADDTNFPRLEHVVIRHCEELKEIPLAIGEIPTLKIIEVHEDNPSVVASARKIQEDQRDYGNDDLQVRITSSW
ncbi:UNVERIFIED_CONTAM: putative late blight resistance proteinR1B-17 [Sesamum radiatum]|uniref:Late blight resistance proteinR1B-17 n=1 Tax=Sesamum radiatum TaxID=300843 RepID=A0AAW2SMB6_SESRA